MWLYVSASDVCEYVVLSRKRFNFPFPFIGWHRQRWICKTGWVYCNNESKLELASSQTTYDTFGHYEYIGLCGSVFYAIRIIRVYAFACGPSIGVANKQKVSALCRVCKRRPHEQTQGSTTGKCCWPSQTATTGGTWATEMMTNWNILINFVGFQADLLINQISSTCDNILKIALSSASGARTLHERKCSQNFLFYFIIWEIIFGFFCWFSACSLCRWYYKSWKGMFILVSPTWCAEAELFVALRRAISGIWNGKSTKPATSCHWGSNYPLLPTHVLPYLLVRNLIVKILLKEKLNYKRASRNCKRNSTSSAPNHFKISCSYNGNYLAGILSVYSLLI